MDLKNLNTPLTREQIDFKVAQVFKGKGDTIWATILAYKDARADMRVLDDVAGQLNWQCTYQRDSKGVLQCTISIWDDIKNQWISKTSNGTESDFESEKGEYSDAFKRAGFMWGIGRQLYDFPTIMIMLSDGDFYEKDGKIKASARLRPNEWKWEVSEDYKTVTAKRKFGTSFTEIYNSNPFKK